MLDLDVTAIRERANADPSFRVDARYWTARIGFDLGPEAYVLAVKEGEVITFRRVDDLAGVFDVRLYGRPESWEKLLAAVPPPACRDLGFGRADAPVNVEGDLISAVGPYGAALRSFVAVMRAVHSGPSPQRPVRDVERLFDSAVGRYVYLRIDGVQYRVYFEEAGQGIPLLLQHTAGADGRQWRHVLEDPDYQRDFRMIAYDLPYHGRSLPPTGTPWWETEYRLTRDFLIKTVMALSSALQLDRPVFMGCSIGGHLAPDLALYQADEFRAVIGINGGLASTGGNPAIAESWYHPRVSNEWKSAVMLANMAPTSPEAYRRETAWVYAQGAPPVLKGDVHYYSVEHDLTADQAGRINTAKTDVYLLTGEYDFLANGGSQALADSIRGAKFTLIPGMGHFGPAEDPEGFKGPLLAVLREIAAKTR